MRGRLLRLVVGLAPFALLAGAILLFVRTRDPRVFTYAGVLAALYVALVLLAGRRRRRGAGRAR